ncbi:sensor histidine kinase [Thermodesulforhabdus norvegica]|uniref:histidine kinase n=1 Tax=Thermodesulforhabdus norvegica TaxID=39841 RepID=A0A1I4SEQ1_9BACT|nr:HAMP domain-containing sensor histidine kinase [Thermodesulforhabdus norvegica]SFM62854.1 Signal transduction histidine kinase [Thermodesulforhabdus norvegica]
MLKMYRYALIAGVAVLFFLALIQFIILKNVFNTHRVSDLTSMVNCIESRITGHMELLRQLPHAPHHMRSLTWLLDELQGYPFLKGILLSERGRILINTMPYVSPDEAKKILKHCLTGYRAGDTYYFCTEFYPLPGRKLFMILALDRTLEVRTLRKSLWFTGISVLAAVILFVLSWYLVARMASRQQELEQRLEASERVAMMGKLAAMVAHEIRNPLNTLSMGLQYMKELGELKPEIMETLMQEIARMSELSLDLLSPDRGIEISTEPLSVQDILSELEHKFVPRAKASGISFIADYPHETIKFTADRKWLLRALENLIRNALEATPEGGSVSISASAGPDYVAFRIEDSGTGIPVEIRSKIFEPFITTKKEGFGLGLYLVKKVVEAHGGTVKLEQSSLGGTGAVVIIPGVSQK